MRRNGGENNKRESCINRTKQKLESCEDRPERGKKYYIEFEVLKDPIQIDLFIVLSISKGVKKKRGGSRKPGIATDKFIEKKGVEVNREREKERTV